MSLNENQEEKRNKDNEKFGTEVRATVDSRIYKRPSFFLSIPLIIAFGGIGSRYENVFFSSMKENE